VDGFNLYHSLVDVEAAYPGSSAKWLDLPALCKSYLPIVGREIGQKAEIGTIFYFSASPTHRSPDVQQRHALYMDSLRGLGVDVSLAQFKRRKEKETDVAIAAKLFEVCFTGSADSVVVVTGDTDLAPAIRMCRKHFQSVSLFFAFPFMRVNDELRALVKPGHSFKINAKPCLRYQLPDPLMLPSGAAIQKPTTW